MKAHELTDEHVGRSITWRPQDYPQDFQGAEGRLAGSVENMHTTEIVPTSIKVLPAPHYPNGFFPQGGALLYNRDTQDLYGIPGDWDVTVGE